MRVLLTIGQAADPAQLGPLPPTVHVERWVRQDDVLPHAAASVGHGGYGTTLGAVAHGVPQVVLPLFAADQWLNARRVAELGAGVMLAEPPGAERRALDLPAGSVLAALPDAIRRILTDPAHRGEARSLAGAVAALPPVEAAVDVLEAIAAGATPGVGRPSARPARRSETSQTRALGPSMAQIKIYGRADRLRPRRDRLSDVLHDCVTEAFDYPRDKRAHRFLHLDPDDFRAPDGRSPDYTIIEVSLFEGRSVEAKKRFFALVFDRFESELGVRPVDVEITLTETPRHNWAMRGHPGDELALDYRVEV